MINPADVCLSVVQLGESSILSAHNYIESIPHMYKLFRFIDHLKENGIEKNLSFLPSFVSKTIALGVASVNNRVVTDEETDMREFSVDCPKFIQKTTRLKLTTFFTSRGVAVTFTGTTAKVIYPKIKD